MKDVERRRAGRGWGDFWSLAKPFWTSEESPRAWALLLAIVGLAGFIVYLSVVLNDWYRMFWDSAQNADGPLFMRLILKYVESRPWTNRPRPPSTRSSSSACRA